MWFQGVKTVWVEDRGGQSRLRLGRARGHLRRGGQGGPLREAAMGRGRWARGSCCAGRAQGGERAQQRELLGREGTRARLRRPSTARCRPEPAPQAPALHCFSGPSPQQPTTSFLYRREKPICSSLPSSLGESLATFRGQSL